MRPANPRPWRAQDALAITVITDGETDHMAVKNGWVIAKLVDSKGCLHSLFISGGKATSSGSQGCLEAVQYAFKQTGVCWDDVKTKVMAVSFDGTSANTGEWNGLGVKLDRDINHRIVKII